jgi:hypothetical protein
MGDLTLREALVSDRLEAFVRQEEARGVELAPGSDLERALAPAHCTAPIKTPSTPTFLSGRSAGRSGRHKRRFLCCLF